jgi:cholesterol transport system auxiliary component
MTRMHLAATRPLVFGALAAVLALAGCSLLSGPPPKLYRVTPQSNFPADLPRLPIQLQVELPSAPAGVDSQRIALTRSPVTIDYFADSEWTDRVPALIQTVLAESFENSQSVIAIDRESAGLRADYVLSSEFRHFEAVYDAADKPPTIWATANVRLIKLSGHDIVAQGSFEHRQLAAANGMIPIVEAFDQALGAVMQDIVVWTAKNPALSRPRR